MTVLLRRRKIGIIGKIRKFYKIRKAIKDINYSIKWSKFFLLTQTTSHIEFGEYLTREDCGKIVKYFTKRGYYVYDNYDSKSRSLDKLDILIKWADAI